MSRFAQRRVRIGAVLAVSAVAVCALSVGQLLAHPGDEPNTHTHSENRFAEDLYADAPSVLPSTDLSLSLLSFAIGVASCLLVVRAMLPTLVRAHCAEIVRDYIDRRTQDSGVKVVVIDREAQARNQTAGAQAVRMTASGQHVRVDEASTVPPPSQPAASQPAASQSAASQSAASQSTADQLARSSGHAAAQSILGSVYEQNVQLRDQLQAQAERLQP